MVHAFVMVKADSVAAETVLDAVLGVGGVTEAHIVAGDFDIIAEVQAEEVYDVLGASATEIRSIDGVVDTKTYVALE
jgi:DNA-binding Lrp family transcriptional regulator